MEPPRAEACDQKKEPTLHLFDSDSSDDSGDELFERLRQHAKQRREARADLDAPPLETRAGANAENADDFVGGREEKEDEVEEGGELVRRLSLRVQEYASMRGLVSPDRAAEARERSETLIAPTAGKEDDERELEGDETRAHIAQETTAEDSPPKRQKEDEEVDIEKLLAFVLEREQDPTPSSSSSVPSRPLSFASSISNTNRSSDQPSENLDRVFENPDGVFDVFGFYRNNDDAYRKERSWMQLVYAERVRSRRRSWDLWLEEHNLHVNRTFDDVELANAYGRLGRLSEGESVSVPLDENSPNLPESASETDIRELSSSAPNHRGSGEAASFPRRVLRAVASLVRFPSSSSIGGTSSNVATDDASLERFAHGRDTSQTPVKKTRSARLKNLIRSGIPSEYRGHLWGMFVGAAERLAREPGEYRRTLETQARLGGAWVNEVTKDVDRTHTRHRLYASSRGRDKLKRILLALGWKRPDIGYCQAINFVASVLLVTMRDEELAFWFLVSMLEHLIPPHYYTSGMEGLIIDLGVFRELIRTKLPRLDAHFQQHNIEVFQFATEWFLCLFVNTLPFETTMRVWDLLYFHGSKVLFRCGLAILKIREEYILSLDTFEKLIMCLQNVGQELYDCDTFVSVMHEKSWIGSFPSSKVEALRSEQRDKLEKARE